MCLGGDEQALGEVEPALGLLLTRWTALSASCTASPSRFAWSNARAWSSRRECVKGSLVAVALEPARCPLEGLERLGKIADESGDVRQVLLDDRRAASSDRAARPGSGALLEMCLSVIEATEVAEQGAQVEVSAELAERISARSQQLQRGTLVLLERTMATPRR